MNRNRYQRRNLKTGLSHCGSGAGVELLSRAADEQVKKECDEIAKALVKEALEGNASATRLLVDLAEGAEWIKNPATIEGVLKVIQKWEKEPRFEEQPGDMPAGVLAPPQEYGALSSGKLNSKYVN
ncbi:hypothetical protein DYQ86_26650 [Acidobacteria bacterium AB60]|nr:hypothetical protein DYQ86_26650 [Acidobacteria bacterium AB60]